MADKESEVVNKAVVKKADLGEQVKEREMVKDRGEVCLQPMVEGGGYVKIPLEEVESFYRFTVCCDWLLCESLVIIYFLFETYVLVMLVVFVLLGSSLADG